MADFFEDSENLIDEEDDIITLHNEVSDKDEDFYHLATLDVDKRWFVVLQPVEPLEDIADDEVLIYEIIENENGEDSFAPIEDEKLLDRVFKEFEKELEKCEQLNDEAE
ncbi:MAG: DUF1292 domain-containing protein [Acidaminococcus sp.]|nr:DUF1292 domain-containing protein [Acidaminococcus sp.]MDD7398195.1 DUF1292 domain-containing protein [Bacillota bacterium]MDY4559204.1 DUF1292 domain-containing protein [Eubacteriales bacterium]MDY5344853.1 DUF1292 domain-containing protein [Eubacteriales bacterium]